MKDRPPEYHSYLLRLWPIQVQGQTIWRATLVHIPGKQERAFADLEHMMEYLKAQTGPIAPEPLNDKADLLE